MADKRRNGVLPGETALRALVYIENNKSYANLALPRFLNQLPPEQRPVTTTIVYGTIQRLNTLNWVVSRYCTTPVLNLTPWIRNIMLQAVYQLLYMEHVTPALVVDGAVRLARRFGHRGVAGLVNAVLRKVSREKNNLPWPDETKEPHAYISLVHSHPLWLVKRWEARYGLPETVRMCAANNQALPVVLRTNFLKITREALREKLEDEGIKTVKSDALPEALKVTVNPGISLGRTRSFRDGLFTPQGESSMHCAGILSSGDSPGDSSGDSPGFNPGDRVLDLCSAPGGKATHIAEKMRNRGEVTAVDLNKNRLALVNKQASRLGIDIINTVVADGRTAPGRFESFSHILLDAPCSGLGVINRRPDLKWHKSEQDIRQLSIIQTELLNAAAAVTKQGGRILYSVCTNEQEETEDIITGFLNSNKSFRAVEIHFNQNTVRYINIYPRLQQKEGFYMALVERIR